MLKSLFDPPVNIKGESGQPLADKGGTQPDGEKNNQNFRHEGQGHFLYLGPAPSTMVQTVFSTRSSASLSFMAARCPFKLKWSYEPVELVVLVLAV